MILLERNTQQMMKNDHGGADNRSPHASVPSWGLYHFIQTGYRNPGSGSKLYTRAAAPAGSATPLVIWVLAFLGDLAQCDWEIRLDCGGPGGFQYRLF